MFNFSYHDFDNIFFKKLKLTFKFSDCVTVVVSLEFKYSSVLFTIKVMPTIVSEVITKTHRIFAKIDLAMNK